MKELNGIGRPAGRFKLDIHVESGFTRVKDQQRKISREDQNQRNGS